ncbi:hypothetical protein CLW00_102119 [Mongoliibacter ruber]|uniref:Uncharacterized protein n=1 Tax=Mongoliibacter ruber TaxID=1750599 RepID=A0A2T0WSG4_9BACT|nr:hypothetical protein CLW00_102119 [Mongoliibacter ruber]
MELYFEYLNNMIVRNHATNQLNEGFLAKRY